MTNYRAIESLHDIVPAVDAADILTICRNGALTLYIDNHRAGVRTVLELMAGRRSAKVQTLGEYDSERNRWTAELSSGWVHDIPQRGRKALNDTLAQILARSQYLYPPEVAVIYRRDLAAAI